MDSLDGMDSLACRVSGIHGLKNPEAWQDLAQADNEAGKAEPESWEGPRCQKEKLWKSDTSCSESLTTQAISTSRQVFSPFLFWYHLFTGSREWFSWCCLLLKPLYWVETAASMDRNHVPIISRGKRKITFRKS